MAELDQTPKDEDVIQLVAERAVVSKVEVETGRIRVSTHVEEHAERISDSLRRHGVDVQRVRLDCFVDEEPVAREENGVLILPVVEEVMVKRFLIKEEVRITRTSTLEPFERDVTLRIVRADVERTAPAHQTSKE